MHGAAPSQETGKLLNFRRRLFLKDMLSQQAKVRKQLPRHVLQVVHEASLITFTLQRDLSGKGIHSEIVVPCGISGQGGKVVKTDRIDVAQLAQFYASDLLTIVQVPGLEMEQDREQLRSRQSLMQERERVCQHLQAILRTGGGTTGMIFY